MVYLSVGCEELCLQIFGQSFGWVMFGIGFVCLLVGGYVLTLGMVLGFFITNLKLSHGFLIINGQIIGHIGSLFNYFFSMWPSVVMCITMGYFFHVWGGVSIGLFLFL